jgi:hypothetical protein
VYIDQTTSGSLPVGDVYNSQMERPQGRGGRTGEVFFYFIFSRAMVTQMVQNKRKMNHDKVVFLTWFSLRLKWRATLAQISEVRGVLVAGLAITDLVVGGGTLMIYGVWYRDRI